MYKNQLQELAQRSCFNLPSYACIREGPDHAPRFKATVNFNGEIFESPSFCSTLRQAEHAAAEVALNTLSRRGPSRSLAAKVLDETGVYKNLLQETAHRAGLNLPVYTTVRSGPGHIPVFSCTVELAGMSFSGEPAKTKKQAQKNAAMAAWSALKQLPHLGGSSSASSSTSLEPESNDEQEQVIIARALASLHGTDGNKPPPQNDRQRGRRKPASARRDTNLSSSLSVYPMPYQSWAYSNFSPDVAMYQMWQQEQVSQQQTRMLALPGPPPPSDPRILPFIQSIFQPNHSQYFPAREQEPIGGVPGIAMSGPGSPLYFPSHSVSIPIRSRVTIQEIHEEKNQGEEEWLRGGTSDADGDPESRRINLQPKNPGFPQNPPVSMNGRAKPEIQEPHEDKQKNGGPGISNMSSDREANLGHPGFKPVSSGSGPPASHKPADPKNLQEIQPEEVRTEPFEWTRGVSMHSQRETGFMPGAPTPSHIQYQLQNPRVLYSSRANQRPHHQLNPGYSRAAKVLRPSSLAAPVTIRTAIPVCSARPRAEGLNNTVMPPVNFMAPAVQVRSVIPVCSAPPTRSIPDTSRQDSEDISAANSELGKLRI
ncbi:double-stranded RNA-binding protein 2-like [Magnolia sinica]|uniref:double-stranded RNA-binding protein 2-like n=1 Tax=Magnolia sinica TaxID=86752 RepID=UPI00265B6EC1|nr:double-stranded RNA-binding protein 2-like [Magnolia sinica]XP_058082582.1 double-stranded RNA-binding protein 2-like [Magnolia sinica]